MAEEVCGMVRDDDVPFTSDRFRLEMERKFNQLFACHPHPGLLGEVLELNKLIERARRTGLTQARAFSDQELSLMESRLMVLDACPVSELYMEYWRTLLEELRELGLESELMPTHAPVCAI